MNRILIATALAVGLAVGLAACTAATPTPEADGSATVIDLDSVADGALEPPPRDVPTAEPFDGDVDVSPVDVNLPKDKPGADPAVPGGLTPDDIGFALNGLAETFDWHVLSEVPYDPALPDNRRAAPPHLLLTFDGERPEDVIADNGRRLAIYPVAAYRALWDDAGDPLVGLTIDHLKEVLAQLEGEETPALPLPQLPPPAGSNDVAVQIALVDFEGGRGVRYVGRFGDAPQLVTGRSLRYYFQGLTDDEQYYVAGVFPIGAAAMPHEVADAAPEVSARLDADLNAYMRESSVVLDGLMPSDWAPPLAQIDELHASLVLPSADAPTPPAPIVDAVWQWQAFEGSDDTIMPVPDPAAYTLELWTGGELHGRADCNDLHGVWRAEGDRIELNVQVSASAVCAAGRLSERYIQWLQNVAAYELTDDSTLSLSLIGDIGKLVLVHSGPVTAAAEGVDATGADTTRLGAD